MFMFVIASTLSWAAQASSVDKSLKRWETLLSRLIDREFPDDPQKVLHMTTLAPAVMKLAEALDSGILEDLVKRHGAGVINAETLHYLERLRAKLIFKMHPFAIRVLRSHYRAAQTFNRSKIPHPAQHKILAVIEQILSERKLLH